MVKARLIPARHFLLPFPEMPVPLLMSISLLVSSAAITCGWIFNIEFLKHPLIGLISIKANTALCFSLSSLSLFCLIKGANGLAKIIVLPLIVISALNLLENLTGFNVGIDQMLALDTGSVNGLPGRMALHTSLGFVIVGLSILFSNRRLFQITLPEISGYLVCLIGLISVVGYAYEVPSFYRPALSNAPYGFTGVSMMAAILFIGLGVNLISLKRDYWFASIWTSGTHGGELLRNFIPLLIALPLALGFAKTYFERVGMVNNEVAITIIVIIMVVGSVIVMARLASRFDKLDAERVKNERQKQDLLYSLAHDMKIPLLGSDKMLQLIISNKFSDLELQKTYLLMVKQSNETLLWMIQNLIYENQNERGLELAELVLTDISALITKSVLQIQSFADSKNIAVQCNLIEQLIVELDPEATKLVLNNVLHNAVKFTNKGSITISTAKLKDTVVIEIIDTGAGITPENQERIFDRIWQSEANKRESAGGTVGGLGLNLCRHIMAAHGGNITYANRASGGSVFSLSFPCKQPDETPLTSAE